jgi:ADP-ribosylglycohydrolase
LLGAIAGDVIGSVYERFPHKSTEFELFGPGSRFTDDSVLTIATAHALLTGASYCDAYHAFGNRYPDAGYGGAFRGWLSSDDREPYGSWGNGSAMRVSPVGLAGESLDAVLVEAARSAAATHDHPYGITGAQAVAAAVFLARNGVPKDGIRKQVAELSGYDLSRSVSAIRATYTFDVSCQGSVPEAITCFLEADDFEHAVRLAVSLGGDADTQAAIAGGIAEAFWGGVPRHIAGPTLERLPRELREIVDRFTERHPLR